MAARPHGPHTVVPDSVVDCRAGRSTRTGTAAAIIRPPATGGGQVSVSDPDRQSIRKEPPVPPAGSGITGRSAPGVPPLPHATDLLPEAPQFRHLFFGEFGVEARGLEVLYDDRPKVSPGVKFKDAELLGMPYAVILGRAFADGKVELRVRGGETSEIAYDDAVAEILRLIAN